MRPFQIENKEALALTLQILTHKITTNGFTITDITEKETGTHVHIEWTLINNRNRKEMIEIYEAMNWKLNKIETEVKNYLVRSNCYQLLTEKTFI